MILLAILAGVGLGYIIERGDMCFHSTIRGLFRRPRQIELLRAYVLTLLIATLGVTLLRTIGQIDPWIAPFAWQANLVGGLIFGVGMVVASTCITGLFYKLGHGMLGTLVALATWAVGDILTYIGPLSGLQDILNRTSISVDGQSATLLNIFGSAGLGLTIIIGVGIAFWLWRSGRISRSPYWGWLPLGLAMGLFISLAWLLADWSDSNYPYGTSSVPTSLYLTLTQGDSLWSPWITITLFSLILGAFLAASVAGTLWIRGETMTRYLELGVGGFLMGVGAAISGGCNLGHSLIGVPLLSLGSIATTLAMVIGVWLAHRAKLFFAHSSGTMAQ